jgi:hypothetical protein
MTRDEIINMAVQCQLVNTGNCDGIYMDALESFAALVAASEREACAKVCDDIDVEYEGEDVLATWCAAAIRARWTV